MCNTLSVRKRDGYTVSTRYNRLTNRLDNHLHRVNGESASFVYSVELWLCKVKYVMHGRQNTEGCKKKTLQRFSRSSFSERNEIWHNEGHCYVENLSDFGELFRSTFQGSTNFRLRISPTLFCRSATKIATVRGLANRHLVPEFRELWSGFHWCSCLKSSHQQPRQEISNKIQ